MSTEIACIQVLFPFIQLKFICSSIHNCAYCGATPSPGIRFDILWQTTPCVLKTDGPVPGKGTVLQPIEVNARAALYLLIILKNKLDLLSWPDKRSCNGWGTYFNRGRTTLPTWQQVPNFKLFALELEHFSASQCSA